MFSNIDNFLCALDILRYLCRRRAKIAGAGRKLNGRDMDQAGLELENGVFRTADSGSVTPFVM
jgi:hypothetical protein